MPCVPSCPTCFTFRRALRTYVLYVLTCFACLRAFTSYVQLFTFLTWVYFFTCVTCPHFFHFLHFSFTCLLHFTQINEFTYDCSSLLLLNPVIYQHLSSIFTSIKLVSYSEWLFLFFEAKNINWDTSTSSQASNFDGVMLEIYLDHKFMWPQEGLNFESLTYKVVT